MQKRKVSYSNEKKWIPFPKVILCTSKGTIKVRLSEKDVFINVILTRSLQCAWLPIENVFLQFMGKFLTFYGISQSYMLSLKCGHCYFMWIPHLISTVKLRLRYKFSQFIHRLKIWVLKCWFWSVYTSNFFPVHERDAKFQF